MVLGHVGVDNLNEIIANWGGEDGGHGGGARGLTGLGTEHGDNRARGRCG